MYDYSVIANTTGSFPSIATRNVTTPGAGDGTPITKVVMDDIWGFFQALMNEVGDTPSGDSEVFDDSQLLDAIKTLCVDGINGGTYAPAAQITLQNTFAVDVSGLAGSDINAIEAHAKGIGTGGVFYGGINTTAAGKALSALGGTPSSSGNGADCAYFQGGNGATTGAGGRALWFTGGTGKGGSAGGAGIYGAGGNATTTGDGGNGATVTGGNGAGGAGIGGYGGYFTGGTGTGNGGVGVCGIGGSATGPGGIFVGYGGSAAGLTLGKQGAVIIAGSTTADGLWVLGPSGVEPSTSGSSYGIWASTGAAYPATAAAGRSDLGIGLVGITASGLGCALTASSTGSPLRIVPQSAEPSTNVADGCIYVDSDDGAIRHYEGSSWKSVVDSTNVTGGSGSAGAGNQYIVLRVGTTFYKCLHDGTV